MGLKSTLVLEDTHFFPEFLTSKFCLVLYIYAKYEFMPPPAVTGAHVSVERPTAVKCGTKSHARRLRDAEKVASNSLYFARLPNFLGVDPTAIISSNWAICATPTKSRPGLLGDSPTNSRLWGDH